MVMNYYKEGVIRPPGAGPATEFWNRACDKGVFDLLHRSMKKRGLPVQSMLLFKFFYQGEGEDTANIVAWLGFTKGTAENPATRVLARRCTLEFKSFLAENGHDIPCFAHEVEITPAGYSYLGGVTSSSKWKSLGIQDGYATARLANTCSSTLGSSLALKNQPHNEGSLEL